MNYRLVNNVTGWIIGIAALAVYLATMEPTTSFWDCGEFLSCGYKLEVGHSPGAPFFMILQRLFAILFGDGAALTAQPNEHAAWAINSLSAVMSALSVLFLFWTITHFGRRLVAKEGEQLNNNQIILIMGAGIVGALANTFSDTFWFSAVEAEVYATSSFFTAFTLWAILKWEEIADEPYADRWLILISYLIGLSVCVHLLNLLTIPPVAMVYYFRKYKFSYKGLALAFLAGCAALAFVQFGVIQYIPKIASWFDIMFTNSFGLPFDTGALVFLVIVAAVMFWSVSFARKKGNYLLHTSLLCLTYILIGYSCYLVAIIRSRADVPIDMTNPDNPISFLDYVNREQFGQQPLFFGPYYTSRYDDLDTSGKLYIQAKVAGKDRYVQVGTKKIPKYPPDQTHFFPRIWDSEGNHANFYRNFLGLKEGEEPSTADNFKFFFTYQMGWMWWRFFMWDFAGRQNDMEGQLDVQKGNWISGIPAIDGARGLGNTDNMGEGYSNNGAHNKLFLLPFFLGIAGLIYQFNRKRNDGIVVLALFFFTGAAIGIFLNMPPLQPRERDYAFAGCTFTFTIWIGLGVLMVNELLQKYLKNASTYVSIGACAMGVPVLMAVQEWDDHDRSRKTLAQAVAYNTLNACAPNAVLFTFGDNQTYPLWYLQEIEGVRKDVRIINTSLLGIDWYVDQLNYKVNDADAVPMMWTRKDYMGENHNYLSYFDNPKLGIPKNQYINIYDVCNFMNSDEPDNKLELRGGGTSNYMPTKNFYVPVPSKEQLLKNGLIYGVDTAQVVTEMKFTYPKEVAFKSDLAILNIIAGVAKEGWKRPLYFDAGLRQGDYAGTGDYMRLEGTVYRLMPYKVIDSGKSSQAGILGTINSEKSFDLFMKYRWGGAERNDVYFDEPNRHELYTYRVQAASVANVLISEGKKDKAILLLDKVMQGITEHSYYYDFTAYFIASAYYRAGDVAKAQALSKKIVRNTENHLAWVSTLSESGKGTIAYDVRQKLQVMNSLASAAYYAGDSTYAKVLMTKLKGEYEPKFQDLLQNTQGGDDEQ